ncbi:MAG: AraC family transcriptional regulator [Pseudomonadota bacterium]
MAQVLHNLAGIAFGHADALPLSDRRNRVMWLNNDRVFYAGLLGAVSVRTMGGWLVYASLGAPLRIALESGAVAAADAPWQSAQLAVVPPWVPHRVACDERLICSITIEPETVDEAALPAWLRQHAGPVPGSHPDALPMLQRVRAAHARLCTGGHQVDWQTACFDRSLFGAPLPARRVDARIARVLEGMRDDPAQLTTAQECAGRVGLSFSRFLHLFKAEVGTPFRSLRTWKRARSLLHHVTRDTNLVHVALDTGYPDSTHFSHSIRQVYGLKPRDLFAGSRQLTVLGDSPAARAAARAEAWR